MAVIATRVIIPTVGGLHQPGIDFSFEKRRELEATGRLKGITEITKTSSRKR